MQCMRAVALFRAAICNASSKACTNHYRSILHSCSIGKLGMSMARASVIVENQP